MVRDTHRSFFYTTLRAYTAQVYIHRYLVCNYAQQQNSRTLSLHTCTTQQTRLRELKRKIRFEENLEYVKGAPSRLFLKFFSGTHGLSGELGRHDKGVGHRNVLMVGL